MRYTSGPWIVETAYDEFTYEREGGGDITESIPYPAIRTSRNPADGGVLGWELGRFHQGHEADATLAAAAPDLLAALEPLHDLNVELVLAAKGLLEALGKDGPTKTAALKEWVRVLDEGKRLLHASEAAIAKAKGEQ